MGRAAGDSCGVIIAEVHHEVLDAIVLEWDRQRHHEPAASASRGLIGLINRRPPGAFPNRLTCAGVTGLGRVFEADSEIVHGTQGIADITGDCLDPARCPHLGWQVNVLGAVLAVGAQKERVGVLPCFSATGRVHWRGYEGQPCAALKACQRTSSSVSSARILLLSAGCATKSCAAAFEKFS